MSAYQLCKKHCARSTHSLTNSLVPSSSIADGSEESADEHHEMHRGGPDLGSRSLRDWRGSGRETSTRHCYRSSSFKKQEQKNDTTHQRSAGAQQSTRELRLSSWGFQSRTQKRDLLGVQISWSLEPFPSSCQQSGSGGGTLYPWKGVAVRPLEAGTLMQGL